MSMNLHTTRTYKVEYGICPVQGWDDIEMFLDFLREQSGSTGGIWCGGDCSACAVKDEGCWSLKPGERILFEAH